MSTLSYIDSKTARRSAMASGVLILSLFAVGCQGADASSAVASHEVQSPVERGQYLVTVAGCGDCHTPFKMGANGPEPDMSRMLAGHPAEMALPPAPAAQGPWLWSGAATNTAFAGPWGVTYAPNLTPHKETGLGLWTEDQFLRAMRTGKHWGQPDNRPILPPMPWQNYARMNADDLKAIYAYLRSVPSVANLAPSTVPAPPLPAAVAASR